jgi:hypothetical protein
MCHAFLISPEPTEPTCLLRDAIFPTLYAIQPAILLQDDADQTDHPMALDVTLEVFLALGREIAERAEERP